MQTAPSNHTQVRTVGRVPAGLPPGTLRWWLPPEGNLADLLRVAAPLALVGLMESIAIAKALAAAAHGDNDANQELVGETRGFQGWCAPMQAQARGPRLCRRHRRQP